MTSTPECPQPHSSKLKLSIHTRLQNARPQTQAVFSIQTISPRNSKAKDPVLEEQNLTAVDDLKPLASNWMASRTRVKRKSPELLVKPSSCLIFKQTRAQGACVPIPSSYVTQGEIDQVLADNEDYTKDLSNRQLAFNKRVDFGWFSANGLDIGSLFADMGLKTFIETYAEVSVSRIGEFYSDLSFYDDGASIMFIKTFVAGEILVFSNHDVCRLYDCKLAQHTNVCDLEENEAYEKIISKKMSLKGYLESTRLDLLTRVLHRAVIFCLVPRVGSLDTITTKDAQLMVHLLHKIPINLGTLVFEHMERYLNQKDKGLPFGQVINGLLMLHGIDSAASSEQDKWKIGNFGANIIANMQYVKTAEGWISKSQNLEPSQNVFATANRLRGRNVLPAPMIPSRNTTYVREDDFVPPHLSHIVHDLQRDMKQLKQVVDNIFRIVECQGQLLRKQLKAHSTDENGAI